MMMWGYTWGMGWGWMLMGGVVMIAFWSAVIWILYLAVRGRADAGNRTEDARSIAARRLALGQITPDEYDRIVAKVGS